MIPPPPHTHTHKMCLDACLNIITSVYTNRGRRPGSATSQRALLTNAERIGTLKRSKDMTGTLPRNKHVVSDYEAEYPVVNSGESMDRPKLDLSEDPKRSSLGYDNPSYDDAGDDFEYK